MRFWQAFIIAAMTASFIRIDQAHYPFVVDAVGGLGLVGIYYLLWRLSRKHLDKETPDAP